MTATQKPLALDAWGGTVKDGEECWIFNPDDFSLFRVESARLVEVSGEAHLLHESRIHKYYRVAKTERDAIAELERTARLAIDLAAKRTDKARRFLASLS